MEMVIVGNRGKSSMQYAGEDSRQMVLVLLTEVNLHGLAQTRSCWSLWVVAKCCVFGAAHLLRALHCGV